MAEEANAHADAPEGEGEGGEDEKYKLPDILLTEFTPQEVNNMQHLFEELEVQAPGRLQRRKQARRQREGWRAVALCGPASAAGAQRRLKV